MKAVRVSQFGGPEVLKLEDIPTPKPGPGQMAKARGRGMIDGVGMFTSHESERSAVRCPPAGVNPPPRSCLSLRRAAKPHLGRVNSTLPAR
jgi:hypothetical protein